MRRDRLELVEPQQLAESIDAGRARAGVEADEGAVDDGERRRLERCFARLSDDQQRTVRLAFEEGRSHPEIAQALARPLGSVKSWIRRGLQSLKECMESCSPMPN
jgi:RNA polymerase sigma-70 factor (ECF subfamily)